MQKEVIKSVEALKSGGCIIYPTDTIWGLGCDPSNDEAIDKLYSIKKRDPKVPLLILLADENQIYNYVQNPPDIAFDLIEMSDRPLTIIFDNGKNVSNKVLGPDGSIGIRICKTEPCYSLLKAWRRPITSTSVNLSGQTPAKLIEEMDEKIKNSVDDIFMPDIDLPESSPSQIIRISENGSIKIIRK